MDDYVSKPLQPEALYAVIEGLAPMATERMPASEEAAATHLDPEVLREHFGGDDAPLKEVAGIFLEAYPGWLVEIRAAVDAGDANRLRIAAHTLNARWVLFGCT